MSIEARYDSGAPPAMYFLSSILVVHPAEAACEAAAPSLDVALDAAVARYVAREAEPFAAEVASAEAAVPCLRAPVAPATAARLHLVRALDRLGRRDRDGAVAAMRALGPGYIPPDALVPPGQFVAGLFAEAAAMAPRARVQVVLPSSWSLLVDGVPSSDRPDGDGLLQVVDPSGAVTWSALGPPLPDVTVSFVAPPIDPVAPPPAADVAGTDRSPAPAVATAAALALTAGAYGWGLANRASFEDPTTPYAEVSVLQERSEVITGVAIGGAALSVALGVWWAVAW